MTDYAKNISDSQLFQEFDKLADIDDVSASEIRTLKRLVVETASIVGPHHDQISETFQQYTLHDLQHLLNIADRIYRILPKRRHNRKEVLPINAIELAILWLAILLHDVGMFVSEIEKQKILESEEYKEYQRHQRKRLEEARLKELEKEHDTAIVIRNAVFAEFVRRVHARRVHKYIDENLTVTDENGMHSTLYFRHDLAKRVGELCESHNWGVRHSLDSRCPDDRVLRLETEYLVGDTRVNFQYLACCLRLGDILDFDRKRTPMWLFHSIRFTEEKSIEEWNKHLSITGTNVNEHSVIFQAECQTPEVYVAVNRYLDWVDKELQECTRLVREFPSEISERYPLSLAPIAYRWKVKMVDERFLAGAFRFQLDYEQIMRLLMDKSLYPDSTLFLRELLQNSLDACRYQKARATERNMSDKYVPRISVWDCTDGEPDSVQLNGEPTIVFQDNGVGMSLDQVERFFMRVGQSYYKSTEFAAEKERLEEQGIILNATSQFGIGFLSCFMAAERIEIITYQYDHDPLKVTILGPNKYFTIERLSKTCNEVRFNSPKSADEDSPPSNPGTQITLWIKEEWIREVRDEGKTVLDVIKTFAANTEFPIHLHSRRVQSAEILVSGSWQKEQSIFTETRPNYHHLASGHGSQHRGVSAGHFSRLVCPAKVALGNTPIAGEIEGQLAICLLRDEHNRPAPTAGFLRYDYGGNGNIIPAPELEIIDAFQHIVAQGLLERGALRRILESTADNQGAMASALQLELKGNLPSIGHQTPYIIQQVEKFPRRWFSFEDGSKNLILRALKQHQIKRSWIDDIDLIDQLRIGRTDWADQSIPTFERFTLRPVQKMALFGVLVPEMVKEWNPRSQVYTAGRFLPECLMGYVDIRGHNAPVPSTNRLFFDRRNIRSLLSELGRVVLDQAKDLLLPHQENLEWQRWFWQFINSLHHAEMGFENLLFEIDDILRWRVFVDYQERMMKRKEIVEEFGAWLPIPPNQNSQMPKFGLSVTNIGLGTRHSRNSSVGVTELNLETIVHD